MLIKMVLEADGHVIHLANSGNEGLDLASQVHPDLVILDIMMPEMDGFTVCSSLREMLNIPILMLTAHSSEKQMVRSFNTGADDFLGKPFGNSELRARVRALLRRSEY